MSRPRRIKSANNLAIEAAVRAIGRGHAMTPGFNMALATELANRIDIVLKEHPRSAGIVALTVCLLQGLGVYDPGDPSRFLSES